MTSDAILQRFDNLIVWARGDQRAPHKPLLILYDLGRWQQGEPHCRNIEFRGGAQVPL